MKKVKASWIISLPYGAVLAVKKGDKVKKGTLIFESTTDVDRVVGFQNELKGLSRVDIEKINEEFKDRQVEKGTVLRSKRGWFSNAFICPMDGKFGKIDELLNLHIIIGVDKRKNFSPIEAVIGDVGNDEIKLEFGAWEFLGNGLSSAKGWVDSGFKIIKNMADINSSCKDSLIIVDELSETVKLKAEVVGVGAIVVLDSLSREDVRINFKIPSVTVDTKTFSDFQEAVVDTESRVLVNGNSGRLLLVI